MEDLEQIYDSLFEAIVNGNAKQALALTEKAVAAGAQAQALLEETMIPAMNEVGQRFEKNEFFVPELLIAARAMKAGVGVLRPMLAAGGSQPTGRVAIGTVMGDLHDVGKNLVAILLEGGGFEVVDLGVDASPQKFIDAINEKAVDIVAMSALLTTTIPSMRTTIEKIKEAGVRDKVKIIVGGAPVTADFAKAIGADGYSDNASGAVTMARQLLAAA